MTRAYINGTPHPLSPRTFTSERQWSRFCSATFPYTTKGPGEAQAQLAHSTREEKALRRSVAMFLKAGSPKAAARARKLLARQQEAVRRGEEYFRRLDAKNAYRFDVEAA